MYIYTLKNSKNLIIRKATVEDTEEILHISNEVAGETSNFSYAKGEYYMTYDQQYTYISNIKDSKNSCFFVGIIDGKIVGSITFVSSSRKRLEHRGEMGIAVLKNYWGIGIGSALIKCFLKWARQNEVTKKIDLLVREDNIAAIALYIKYGFKIEGKISMGMRVDNRTYDIYMMGKMLK